MDTKAEPKTLIEAVRHFANADACDAYMERIKWPDGQVCCPKCGSIEVGRIKSRRLYQCKAKECRKQFSAKVGTIFEDSPLGLDKWFVAVWCITNAKNGISSCELARAIGVTQKSAWHMLHRVRVAMQTRTFRRITGEVESDETAIGGLAKNMHKSVRARRIKRPGVHDKTLVQGLMERGGEVRARVIPDASRSTLQSIVRENVTPGSAVYTDKARGYIGLDSDYLHGVVDHAIEYVRGRVHTNSLENFWALLKRSLSGTYVAVDPAHLDAYLAEQCMRFNQRKGTDAARFANVMQNVRGRRLQYKELIARGQEAP